MLFQWPQISVAGGILSVNLALLFTGSKVKLKPGLEKLLHDSNNS